jgi:hypothetical protein
VRVFLFLLLAALPGILIAALVYFCRKRAYEKSEHFADTHTLYRAVRWDLGQWGEYLTFRYLSKLDGYKKFLFNCYIPKDDGALTEIDLIMLHGSGVYVFESKNYSGWIFGNEADLQWTQSFRNGHKERFYNPIKQNSAHIKQLRRFLPGLAADAIQSVIVFSERCELRKITLTSHRHIVVKRDQVLRAVRSVANRQALSPTDIDVIYQRLFPQTQLTAREKETHRQHVADIAEGRTCPCCGSPLVPRTAKSTGNQFLGCSKYPACRYTANI